jgi:S1-C subfamily serine protease
MNLPRLLPFALLLAAFASFPAAAQSAHPGRPVHEQPADVGFNIEVLTNFVDGQLVTADYPVVSAVRAPAEAAGLKTGDVILAIDGRDSRDGPMFRDLAPGKRYRLHVRRGGEELDLELEAAAPRRPAATSGS